MGDRKRKYEEAGLAPDNDAPLFAKRMKHAGETAAPITSTPTQPFKPPSQVYEICERSKGVKVMNMAEVLRGGQGARAAEPDTPVLAHQDHPTADDASGWERFHSSNNNDTTSSRGASLASTESDPHRLLAPAYFTHDAVITPASYQGLLPPPAMSPGESERQTATTHLLQLFKHAAEAETTRGASGGLDPVASLMRKIGTTKHDLYSKVLHHTHLAYQFAPQHVQLATNAWVFSGTRGDLKTLREVVDTVLPFGEAALCPYNIVVLGDFIGTAGASSLECLLYLFALRLTAPNVVHIIRGASEELPLKPEHASHAPAAQLLASCAEQFGAERGAVVYESIASILSSLPVACSIDEKLFVSYSGVSPKKSVNQSLLAGLAPPTFTLEPSPPQAQDMQLMQRELLRSGSPSYDRTGVTAASEAEAVQAFLDAHDYDMVLRAPRRHGFAECEDVISVPADPQDEKRAGLVLVRRHGQIEMLFLDMKGQLVV